MTKKEQAAFDALMAERDLYRSWRISEEVNPDLPPPKSFDGVTHGWLYVVPTPSSSPRAMKAASKRVYHRVGDEAWSVSRTSWSQNARSLYSTKSLALKAARHEAFMYYAKELARLDKMIEAALAEEAGSAA